MSIARARYLRSNITRQEARLWVRLRGLKTLGLHFRRQVPIEGYYLDFACFHYRIAIELDGSQHAWPDGLHRDARRDAHLARIGFRTLRIWNVDIDRDIGAVVDHILTEIDPSLVEDLRRL